jgi:hypothetical protein
MLEMLAEVRKLHMDYKTRAAEVKKWASKPKHQRDLKTKPQLRRWKCDSWKAKGYLKSSGSNASHGQNSWLQPI